MYAYVSNFQQRLAVRYPSTQCLLQQQSHDSPSLVDLISGRFLKFLRKQAGDATELQLRHMRLVSDEVAGWGRNQATLSRPHDFCTQV